MVRQGEICSNTKHTLWKRGVRAGGGGGEGSEGGGSRGEDDGEEWMGGGGGEGSGGEGGLRRCISNDRLGRKGYEFYFHRV